MQKLIKTTIEDLLKEGKPKSTEVYVMVETEDNDGVYFYYMSVLSKMFDVDLNVLLSKSRVAIYCELRTMAWTRLIDINKWSYSQISQYSGRSTSNMIQLVNKFKDGLGVVPMRSKMYDAFNYAVEQHKDINDISTFSYSFK